MNVTIEPFVGDSMVKNLDGTTRAVKFDQYRVRVDRISVGYIGFAKGSKLQLFAKFSPVEIQQIESAVAVLVDEETVSSVSAPEVPAELLSNSEDEDFDEDDFDA
jgi:hypothetical protein